MFNSTEIAAHIRTCGSGLANPYLLFFILSKLQFDFAY